MAINWTSATFEQQPRNLTNPGYGADAIKTGKVATRERGEVEHFWGDNESLGSLGRHWEGAARLFILDDNSSTRDGRLTSARITGQAEVDLSDQSPVPEIDGVPITNVDSRFYKLIFSTYDENDNKQVVFDPTLYVSKDLDQTVTADITFTGDLTVPDQTPSEVVGETLTGDEKEFAIPYKRVRGEVNQAFYWNIYDKGETLNTGYFGLSGSELDINISANEVRANAVYGTVWA